MALTISRGSRTSTGVVASTGYRPPLAPLIGLVPILPAGPEVRLEIAGPAVPDPGNPRWEEVDLPRQQNTLEWVGRGVQRQKFTAVFDGEIDAGGEQAPVQSWINQLYELAMPSSGAESAIVTVNGPLYGNFAGYFWRVESVTPSDDVRRRDSDGEICHHTIEVTLARHRDTGILTTKDASPAEAAKQRQQAAATATGGEAPKASGKTYTVVKGDTLSGIAAKQLGSAGRFTEIAKLNGIRDPGSIKPGQVLKLP